MVVVPQNECKRRVWANT